MDLYSFGLDNKVHVWSDFWVTRWVTQGLQPSMWVLTKRSSAYLLWDRKMPYLVLWTSKWRKQCRWPKSLTENNSLSVLIKSWQREALGSITNISSTYTNTIQEMVQISQAMSNQIESLRTKWVKYEIACHNML